MFYYFYYYELWYVHISCAYFDHGTALLFFLSAALVPRRGYFIANDEYHLADFIYECGPFLLVSCFLVCYIVYIVKLTLLKLNFGMDCIPTQSPIVVCYLYLQLLLNKNELNSIHLRYKTG